MRIVLPLTRTLSLARGASETRVGASARTLPPCVLGFHLCVLRVEALIQGEHHFTVTGRFGSSPNISGAYSASVRVDGRSKRPGLLSLTVYAILNFPFGTNW
jgi:hypothetical protein